jgi:hypothetical protein
VSKATEMLTGALRKVQLESNDPYTIEVMNIAIDAIKQQEQVIELQNTLIDNMVHTITFMTTESREIRAELSRTNLEESQ